MKIETILENDGQLKRLTITITEEEDIDKVIETINKITDEVK